MELTVSPGHAIRCERVNPRTLAIATPDGVSVFCPACRRRHLMSWELLAEVQQSLKKPDERTN